MRVCTVAPPHEQQRRLLAVLTRAVATVSPPRQLVTPYAEKVLPNPEQSLNETFYGSITSRFAEQARLHPERPAIYEDDR